MGAIGQKVLGNTFQNGFFEEFLFRGALLQGLGGCAVSVLEESGQLVGALEGGEDQGRPLVLGLGVGVEAGQDEVSQSLIAQVRSPVDVWAIRTRVPGIRLLPIACHSRVDRRISLSS